MPEKEKDYVIVLNVLGPYIYFRVDLVYWILSLDQLILFHRNRISHNIGEAPPIGY